jgi:hypothetical protein
LVRQFLITHGTSATPSIAVVCFGRLSEPVEHADEAVGQPAAVAGLIIGRLRGRRFFASLALAAASVT